MTPAGDRINSVPGICSEERVNVRQQKKGPFFGWFVVGSTTLCISTGPGPFAFAALGLFIIPFETEFGWDRTQISACLTLLVAATDVSVPVIGRCVDKLGSRAVLFPSLVIFSLCLAAIPIFVSELWHLVLVFFLIGTIAAGTNSVPYMPVLSAWFFKYRGLAIGLSDAGIGLGYAYVPLLLQFLIDNAGWRYGYYALSAIVLFIALPLAYFFLKESPAEMGLKPDGQLSGEAPRATRKDVGLDGKEIARQREFWILVLIFVLLSFALNGMLSHLVPMLSDRGMGTGSAAAVAATVGITVFISRIVIGYLIDHFFAPYVAILSFSLSALGIAVFALGAVDAMAFFGAICVGLSLGAEGDLLAYLTGRYFGLKSFGATFGFLFSAVLVGTALGPLAFCIGFDTTGSYTGILTICVGLNILVVVLTAFLGRYPDWEKMAAS